VRDWGDVGGRRGVLTAEALNIAVRAFKHAVALGAVTLALTTGHSLALDAPIEFVIPASLSWSVIVERANAPSSQPVLTTALLVAYVERQKELRSFNSFDVEQPQVELTEAVLSSYIAKKRNPALEAIEVADLELRPSIDGEMLASYAKSDYVPTEKKVELADDERLCLTQAIYHEARGETIDGQWAVANIIINRAMSKRYPTTICGVVFQNASKGFHRCQFTFACDGRSDMGTERRAWARAEQIAVAAFTEFQHGQHPGVIPNNALFYHTRSVAPSWSHTYKRVAAIGSHLFYAMN
jgi:spore germination cell wall hydrolase CwlJ-like protein